MPKKIDTAGLKHFKGKENAMIAGKPESTNTATVAHAVGEYFYWKGVLHIVTAAIAVGGTIQTNTNVKPAVLADDVSDLKESLDEQSEAIDGLIEELDISHDDSGFVEVEIINKTTAEYTNGAWTENGSITTTTAALRYNAINLINVVPGCSYRINKLYGYYFLFDENGVNGTQSEIYTQYTNVSFTVPTGKYKIGINVRTDRFSSEFALVRTSPTPEESAEYPIMLDDFSLIPENIYKDDTVLLVSHLKGKKIVCFGDSLIGNDQDESGVNMSTPAMLSKRTGATCYNAGFGGCRMAEHPTSYFNAFSMYQLAQSISSGSWTTQEQALVDGEGNLPSYFSNTVKMLEEIDWSEIDIITIAYGTNDFTGNVSESDFKKALSDSISDIITAYPNIKILVVSPMYRWYMDSSNIFTDDSDTHTNGNGDLLTDFCDWCKEECDIYHFPFSNTYTNLGVNSINRLTYFYSTDGTHPNVNGRWLRANKIANDLLSAY